jgi:VWFA-related protein
MRIPLVLILFCGALTGQDTVFRVTTTVVQIDAEVTDSKGKHVTNLGAEDFEVFLDRKPQPITNFSYVNLDSPTVNQAAIASAPNGSVAVIRPENVRRSMVVLVDDLTLSFQSMHYVRQTLRNFVEHQMQPGDLVAIWQTGHADGVFQQFTFDKHILNAAIDNLHWNIRNENLMAYTPLLPLATLDRLVDELRETGGRKAVVFLTDGIGGLAPVYDSFSGASFGAGGSRAIEEVHRLLDKANRAGVVIHAVDARGLQAGGGAGPSQVWLQIFAESTGGLCTVNSNGYAEAMQRIEEDQKGYYLIGFRAPEGLATEQDAKKPENHSIQLKVKNKALHVRTRAGFIGQTDEAARPKADTPEIQMSRAVYSLYSASGIHMRLTPQYTLTAKGRPVVHNLLYVDLHDVSFHPDPFGDLWADLDLMVMAQAYQSDTVKRSHHMAIHGNTEQVRQFRERGLALSMDVPVKHTGPYQIRSAVRDSSSGALGSAGQYLDIPNLKKNHIVLTTPRMAAVPTTDANDVSQALREFRSGSEVSFAFLIWTERQPAALDAHIELYRDNQSILTSPVSILPVEGGSARAVKGVLRLPATVSPGQYYLKATAVEASDKQPRTATAWSDFRVLP